MNLLHQLTHALRRSPPTGDWRRGLKPGSLSDRLYHAMSDGQEWSAIDAAGFLRCSRSSARSAMRRLVDQGLIYKTREVPRLRTENMHLFRRRN